MVDLSGNTVRNSLDFVGTGKNFSFGVAVARGVIYFSTGHLAYGDVMSRTEGRPSHSVIPCRLRATIAWNLLGLANGCRLSRTEGAEGTEAYGAIFHGELTCMCCKNRCKYAVE